MLYVAIEGNEGAGKTTAVGILSALLPPLLVGSFRAVREPSTSSMGRAAREFFVSSPSPDPMTAALWMALDRRIQHAEIWGHGPETQGVLLSDRSLVTTYACQASVGYGRLDELHAGIRIPDVIFFLDVPLAVSQDRCRRRGEELNNDQIKVLHFEYQRALRLFEDRATVVHIHGTQNPVVVASKILGYLLRHHQTLFHTAIDLDVRSIDWERSDP